MFLIFLWESALIGVSGVMTLKADGQWGLSIVGNLILIFGDLFWFSKIWLAVICLLIGSVVGVFGFVIGLGTSLTKNNLIKRKY